MTVTTHTRLVGSPAMRALVKLLPHLNGEGGNARTIREAVGVIESAATVDGLLRVASASMARERGFWGRTREANADRIGAVGRLPTPLRLALEIALHEEDERRAMHGELHELETRWREAEAIATIADSLLLPPWVTDRLEELREHPVEAKCSTSRRTS